MSWSVLSCIFWSSNLIFPFASSRQTCCRSQAITDWLRRFGNRIKPTKCKLRIMEQPLLHPPTNQRKIRYFRWSANYIYIYRKSIAIVDSDNLIYLSLLLQTQIWSYGISPIDQYRIMPSNRVHFSDSIYIIVDYCNFPYPSWNNKSAVQHRW